MIGYKATYNGKCLNQIYEVGQTYTLNDEIIMCVKGFHFCQDLYNVFDYYPPNKNLKVFKIEALGNIETNDDKSVTDNIKILEEVNLSNIIVEKNGIKKYFDNKGNYIKFEYCNSYYWEKYEYNENNNKIKTEYSGGCWEKWEKYEYDLNNNLIKKEDSYGYWTKYEYNENNKCIKVECSDGYWEKYEYDLNNNLIKTEYGRG
ncbi:hypothetical protein M0P65_05465 [Candidatus Gracilibacteria bacterium]|nr:hypothetical protein [Candidatus Gracilibacteria bacterium]